jgi:hypothetical protein
MFRRPCARLIAATATALCVSTVALADDTSTSPFAGSTYRYFNGGQATADAGQFNRTAAAATGPSWRQSHPNGLTERELQALSSSALSASATQFDAPVLAGAADPTWRQSHRNGLTERELQALSSSELSAETAAVDAPILASAAADPTWRQTHPNGLTERELQVLSSSSLAMLPSPAETVAGDPVSVAQSSVKGTFSARLAKFFRLGTGT